MKFIANPVEVDAFTITEIYSGAPDGYINLCLDNGDTVQANPEMLARMVPRVGDYWVIQSDGYVYLNPKEVFQRKYRAAVVRDQPFNEYLLPADRPVIEELKDFELVWAKQQPQYIPLRTLVGNTPRCPVLSRWTLTPKQRQAVTDGADIFLELLTFRDEMNRPNPLQPIKILISDEPNAEHFRSVYNLETQEEMWRRTGKEIAKTIRESKGNPETESDKVPGPHKPPTPPGTEVG